MFINNRVTRVYGKYEWKYFCTGNSIVYKQSSYPWENIPFIFSVYAGKSTKRSPARLAINKTVTLLWMDNDTQSKPHESELQTGTLLWKDNNTPCTTVWTELTNHKIFKNITCCAKADLLLSQSWEFKIQVIHSYVKQCTLRISVLWVSKICPFLAS